MREGFSWRSLAQAVDRFQALLLRERRLLSPLFVDILALENRRCFEDIVNKASPTDKSKKCAPPPKTDAHTWTCSSSCTEKLGELSFTERNYHSRSYLGREGVMSCFLTSRMIDHQLIKQKVSRLQSVCAFSCACLCDCMCVEHIHFVPPLSLHSWMEVRTCTLLVIFPCLSHHNGGQVAAVTLLTTDSHAIFIKLLQNSDNKILSWWFQTLIFNRIFSIFWVKVVCAFPLWLILVRIITRKTQPLLHARARMRSLRCWVRDVTAMSITHTPSNYSHDATSPLCEMFSQNLQIV